MSCTRCPGPPGAVTWTRTADCVAETVGFGQSSVTRWESRTGPSDLGTMPRPQPHSHPDGFWPSCDDEPPDVSIQPFSHANLAALLAHLDHDQETTRPCAQTATGRPSDGAAPSGTATTPDIDRDVAAVEVAGVVQHGPGAAARDLG